MNSNEVFGTIQIPQGRQSVQVTGLGLAMAPCIPELTVILPIGGTDFIFAYLIGSTTTDGFTIGLSAAPSASGCSVKWKCGIPQISPSPQNSNRRYGIVSVPQGQQSVTVTGLGLGAAPLLQEASARDPDHFEIAYRWAHAVRFTSIGDETEQTVAQVLRQSRWTEHEEQMIRELQRLVSR